MTLWEVNCSVEAVFRADGLKLRHDDLGSQNWVEIPILPLTSLVTWVVSSLFEPQAAFINWEWGGV